MDVYFSIVYNRNDKNMFACTFFLLSFSSTISSYFLGRSSFLISVRENYQDILFWHLFLPRPQVHRLLILSSMSAKALLPQFSPFHLPYLQSLLISAEYVLTVSHKQRMSTACCLSQLIPGGLMMPTTRQ